MIAVLLKCGADESAIKKEKKGLQRTSTSIVVEANWSNEEINYEEDSKAFIE